MSGKVLLGLCWALAAGVPIPEVKGRPVEDAARLRLVPLAAGLELPVAVVAAPEDEEHLYAVERAGLVKVLSRRTARGKGKGTESWHVLGRPFLDATRLILMRSDEQGLLAMAFHPDFKENREFFTMHTDLVGDLVVSRWKASSPTEADSGSSAMVLVQKHPIPFNYGGSMAFGPEGYLYIGLGDGGLRGDPAGNAQNAGTWLGKILRLDPKPGEDKPYTIPTDNPFPDTPGTFPEIWSLGLRDPRSLSFDGHHLYAADVGERWDEVEVEHLKGRGGRNYGWSLLEGPVVTGRKGRPPERLVPPTAAIACEPACGVVGGPVYQGKALAEIQGAYLYGKKGSDRLWMLRYDDGRVKDARELTEDVERMRPPLRLSALGRDSQGEVLVVDGEEGVVYKLEKKKPRENSNVLP